MARPRVLITGFGPFPGVPDNPSAWLAAALADRPRMNFDGELHLRVLPTEWRIAELTGELFAALQPHVMIHFGVDPRAKALRLERFAHNRAERRADASGALPESAKIAADGPDRHDTKLPTAKLAEGLKHRGLPAVSSRSAGSYLCNFLYYHSLAWALRQHEPCFALFVHIPPVGAARPFTEDALLAGAREILSFALDVAHAEYRPRAFAGEAVARKEPLLSAKEA